MSDDDSSDLSSAPSDGELDRQLNEKGGILKFLTAKKPQAREASPPRPPREPSPPHEYVLADNPDIAFIVMFRARFTEAFPKSLANFGPQELERDVVDIVPGEHVEHFLCALLGLLLNRKQDIKPGHYNRALEEAIQSHKSQWAKNWESKNPLSGGATFSSMSPTERLTLLRTLVLWSLSSSDIVKGIINASYKQNRHEDDLNQPLSVQPWGSDGYKRRFYLIEGLDDTHFRVYRESGQTAVYKRTWWSVASDIDELKQLAHKLEHEDRGQKARLLSSKMLAAVPRFEATEEKRKRREYRQARKQQFKRPEPNLSLYEGRTRGKRIKYTYSDDDDDESYSDATTYRRSTRNTGTHTPAEGPTVTQSGRQVKSRQGGVYGETMLSGAQTPAASAGNVDGASEEPEGGDDATGRPRRGAGASRETNGYGKGGAHIEGYNSVDEMDSEEDDASEQDYGDDEDEDDHVPLDSDNDDQDDFTDAEDELMDEVKQKSLVVKLPVKTPTPERKMHVQLPAPEEQPIQPISFSSTANSAASQETRENQQPTEISSTSQAASATQAASSFDAKSTAPSLVTEPSSESGLGLAKNSLGPSPPSPLALRGSPEKPQAFKPPINVGYGGP